MSQYTYKNLQDKLCMWNLLISMRENTHQTFKKMASTFNVSERRIRTEYENAVKVREWNNRSALWRMMCTCVPDKPASYAVRLYGLLTANGIRNVEELYSTPIETVEKFKGVGPEYLSTVEQMQCLTAIR